MSVRSLLLAALPAFFAGVVPACAAAPPGFGRVRVPTAAQIEAGRRAHAASRAEADTPRQSGRGRPPERGTAPAIAEPDAGAAERTERDFARSLRGGEPRNSRRSPPADPPAPLAFPGPYEGGAHVVVVRPGESYSGLARRAYGDLPVVNSLARYNAKRIPDPAGLRAGMKVVCPPPATLARYRTGYVVTASPDGSEVRTYADGRVVTVGPAVEVGAVEFSPAPVVVAPPAFVSRPLFRPLFTPPAYLPPSCGPAGCLPRW